jgi:hypothetical protein
MIKENNQRDGFPLAIAVYNNKEVNIPFIEKYNGRIYHLSKVVGSVQHLEYSIAEGLNKINKAKQKIAIIKGNELQDI